MRESLPHHKLPDVLWLALLEQPERELHFEQGRFRVEVRLIPLETQSVVSTTIGLSAQALFPHSSANSALDSPPSIPALRPDGEHGSPPNSLSSLPSFASVSLPPSTPSLATIPAEQGHGSETVLCAVEMLSSPATKPSPIPPSATPVPPSLNVSPPFPATSPSSKTSTVSKSATNPPSMRSKHATLPPSTLTPLPGSVSTEQAYHCFQPTTASTSGLGMAPGLASHTLSIGGTNIGNTNKHAPDLSTHAGIQRIPGKMKTAEWKKLIGEATPHPRYEEIVEDIVEEFTMLEIQPIRPPRPESKAGANTPKAPSESQVFFQEMSDRTDIPSPEKTTPPPATQPVSMPSSSSAANSPSEAWSVELELDQNRISSSSNQQAHGEWKKHSLMVFRLLRADDTVPALKKLFLRLSAPLSSLDGLFKELPPYHPTPSQFAQTSGVSKVLQQPVPFCYKGETNPTFRIVGLCEDQSLVILFQQPDSKNLVFVPLDMEGDIPQIALIEGNSLLLEHELTELFQQGARTASPEEAKAKALQVQKHLRPTGSPKTTQQKSTANPAANFAPPSTNHQVNGLDKSIPVDQRLLNRFEFHRNHNRELWDEELQPGVAVFRQNAATLYLDNQAAIEGVLLCLIKQQQYMVFDRRSKRSIHLQLGTQQRLWLRKDDGILQR